MFSNEYITNDISSVIRNLHLCILTEVDLEFIRFFSSLELLRESSWRSFTLSDVYRGPDSLKFRYEMGSSGARTRDSRYF